MLRTFFDPENSLWQAFGKVADVLMLSILWLFLSLPLVTLGAATAGLYDGVVKCLLPGRSGAVVKFWETFRQEFKTATLSTLLWGAPCALLIWLVWTVRGRVVFEGAAAVGLLAVWFLVLLVPVGCLCWMFPLLSRFTFTPTRLVSTALRLTLGYLPRTFVIVLSALAGVILSDWLLVPALVLPALVAVVWAKMMESVFASYS